VRRELSGAKSRAFVNDSPAPLTVLKELGDRLVDIHSQHQNLLLGKQDFQVNVVDIIACDNSQLDSYKETFGKYQDTARRLDELKEETERNRQNADFLQFQYDELCSAKLTVGEQEELEQQSDTMTHAEDIKSALYEADNALDGEQNGIVQQLRSAMSSLLGIGKVFPAADELATRMDTAYIELKDIAAEVSTRLESIDFDPSELDAVNARLDRIYDLQKKYHVDTVEALIEQRDTLGRQLEGISNSDETLAELQSQLDTLRAKCVRHADILTELRTKAAKHIEKDMQQRLVPLGMPHVRFAVSIEKTEPGRNGQDKVSFLFSANTSTPLQPISQVASGGEIARVMLSLKAMISGAAPTPTIIFDEIDTGVSGKIAEKMAETMREMGQQNRQVISITHLPQIAALGTTHYKVYKEETTTGTISRMQQLTAEERVTEIAQMLSGSNVSEAAIANAKQLLKN
jgi:DNA repair protein RecN (Recombination protein N)